MRTARFYKTIPVRGLQGRVYRVEPCIVFDTIRVSFIMVINAPIGRRKTLTSLVYYHYTFSNPPEEPEWDKGRSWALWGETQFNSGVIPDEEALRTALDDENLIVILLRKASPDPFLASLDLLDLP